MPDGNHCRAFLLDDDPDFLEALGAALRAAGYAVDAFTEPSRALEHLRSAPRPDVVLLDYMLPEMNGLQFMRALKAASVDVPVVLLAGRDNRALGVLPVHFARVFRKPFPVDDLLAELAVLTGRPAMAQTAGASG
jgi:two-component system, OmpR family, response regulator